MTMVWTDERINLLQELWHQGHSASEIAQRLGGISRNAVIGKAHRLELPSRPSPIKREEKKVVAPSTPGAHGCMWPIGDPKTPDFHFCGQPASPGRPYCSSHCQQAYQRREEAA